tara:strand:- start:85 stop:1182 length:1098 start_codon:yes stop_codon:yes gene_type:complete
MILDKHFSTRLELNENILKKNIEFLRKKVSSQTEIIAVLKANAYGFGDILLAKKMIKQGIEHIAVADFEEGIRLRRNGIRKSIIIMYPGLNSLGPIIKNNLEPTIYSLEMLNMLIFQAKKYKKNIFFHLKIDTGMSRYGFLQDEITEVIIKIKSQKNLKIKSIFSHFSSSKRKDHKLFSMSQIEKFKFQKKIFEDSFSHKIKFHISNSYGLLNFPDANFDMVRIGFGLYYGFNNKQTNCIGELKSSIAQIKLIKKGESIGYNRCFIAKKDMKIGIIPIGYADGLRRSWGYQKLSFVINKQNLPILGEISMDSCIVDLTNLTNITAGEEVVLFGKSRSIFDICDKLNIIPYEITAALSKRIRRVLS